MFKKIKALIKQNRAFHIENSKNSRELKWAHVYHDSIRGINWIESLPLNIGRWAGGYPFFYVLNRVLRDYKPNLILEMGLGESSKFISAYLDNSLLNSSHFILEQDEKWLSSFQENFKISKRSNIIISPLVKKNIKNNEVNCYSDLSKILDRKYDLYVIDGPFGSENISRYEIIELADKFSINDDFIIIMDDYNRVGEQKTIEELCSILDSKGIKFYKEIYSGLKSVFVLGTEKYMNVRSL